MKKAALQEIGEAQARNAPRHVTYGVSNERAWEVGLACGGTIKVYVEPTVSPRVLAAARGEAGAVVATVVEGMALGTGITFREDGSDDATPADAWLRDAIATPVRDALRLEASTTIETGSWRSFQFGDGVSKSISSLIAPREAPRPSPAPLR